MNDLWPARVTIKPKPTFVTIAKRPS